MAYVAVTFPIKRNPWVVLCSHSPINDSSGYLDDTVYPAVMLQAPWHTGEDNSHQVHISSHDGLQTFITSTLLIIGLRVSQSGNRVAGIRPSFTKH